MEILRKELLKELTNLQNSIPIDQNSERALENTFLDFFDAMFNILSKYDPQVLDICETVSFICFYIEYKFLNYM